MGSEMCIRDSFLSEIIHLFDAAAASDPIKSQLSLVEKKAAEFVFDKQNGAGCVL